VPKFEKKIFLYYLYFKKKNLGHTYIYMGSTLLLLSKKCIFAWRLGGAESEHSRE